MAIIHIVAQSLRDLPSLSLRALVQSGFFGVSVAVQDLARTLTCLADIVLRSSFLGNFHLQFIDEVAASPPGVELLTAVDAEPERSTGSSSGTKVSSVPHLVGPFSASLALVAKVAMVVTDAWD